MPPFSARAFLSLIEISTKTLTYSSGFCFLVFNRNCFVIFFSCNNHQEEKDLSIKVDKLEEELKNLKEEEISGTYIGDFGSNLINITLFDCKDGIAKGYSVCAGNDRDISGFYNHIGDGLY